MKKIKIYRHFYDNNLEIDGKTEKPNEFLGEFETDGEIDGYNFEFIGTKDGKKYRVIGQEISFLADRYNAGTKCFVEEIN